MKENIVVRNSFLEENEKIQKEVEVASTTEGFLLLTEKQQKIIKLSLYVQARAERKKIKEPLYYQNKNSARYVDDRNCHSAILGLEKEDLQKVPGDITTTSDFFEAKYNPALEIGELKKQIEEFGFPCVLHVSGFSDGDFYSQAHSALVLGHDKEDTIVLWEKKGHSIDYPYRITTLDDVYNTYGKRYYYGLRKLRHND